MVRLSFALLYERPPVLPQDRRSHPCPMPCFVVVPPRSTHLVPTRAHRASLSSPVMPPCNNTAAWNAGHPCIHPRPCETSRQHTDLDQGPGDAHRRDKQRHTARGLQSLVKNAEKTALIAAVLKVSYLVLLFPRPLGAGSWITSWPFPLLPTVSRSGAPASQS